MTSFQSGLRCSFSAMIYRLLKKSTCHHFPLPFLLTELSVPGMTHSKKRRSLGYLFPLPPIPSGRFTSNRVFWTDCSLLSSVISPNFLHKWLITGTANLAASQLDEKSDERLKSHADIVRHVLIRKVWIGPLPYSKCDLEDDICITKIRYIVKQYSRCQYLQHIFMRGT